MENNNTNNQQDVDLTDEQVIDLFVLGMLQEKGIEVGDDPQNNKLFVEVRNDLMGEIDRSLIAALPDDKLDEFSAKAENNEEVDPKFISQALIDAKVNVEDIVTGTMMKFREIYLGNEGEKPEES